MVELVNITALAICYCYAGEVSFFTHIYECGDQRIKNVESRYRKAKHDVLFYIKNCCNERKCLPLYERCGYHTQHHPPLRVVLGFHSLKNKGGLNAEHLVGIQQRSRDIITDR